MSIASGISSSIRRFGSEVVIEHDGRQERARAFIQPLRRRHRLYIGDRFTPAGYFDNAYRLYIGEGSQKVGQDAVITVNRDERYTVVTSEAFSVGDKVIYIWAILSPKRDIGEVYADECYD